MDTIVCVYLTLIRSERDVDLLERLDVPSRCTLGERVEQLVGTGLREEHVGAFVLVAHRVIVD